MAAPANALEDRISKLLDKIETPRKWSLDDLVVVAFAFLGFGGALFLPLRFNIPPIEIAFLLATGLAALTYRFLGGIPGTTFVIGALKLGGALHIRQVGNDVLQVIWRLRNARNFHALGVCHFVCKLSRERECVGGGSRGRAALGQPTEFLPLTSTGD